MFVEMDNVLKKNKQCKFVGCKISRSEVRTCKWISKSKYSKSKKCCTYSKVCKCAKCHKKKLNVQ